ncbi:sulfotransferase family 2 domain-containing protein [Owenweeksia hongkongensis]|uniref:sulfotransferase family 2 domain-containing protein n=1 Tax=Owenweeksia hongkongensis TaxID=253245 RepID=UPI003A93D0C6
MKLDGQNIELVSLHIPKTAGTSFRTILEESFGRRSVVRFDIYKSGEVYLKDKPIKGTSLGRKTRVIHGHFSYQDFVDRVDYDHSIPMVTWLRHPLQRTLSNYYFLNKIIADRLKERPEENLMKRMGRSLMEFVAQEENQNIMNRFLEGADLKQFKFVGIQDDFEEELIRFEKTMGWKGVVNRVHNATNANRESLTAEERAFILEANKKDMELYQEALRIRNANQNKGELL